MCLGLKSRLSVDMQILGRLAELSYAWLLIKPKRSKMFLTRR